MGFRENEPVMGEILVSFSVLDPRKQFSKSLDDIVLNPKREEYNVTINVLGLRDLQSPGILPVRKPFIKFMLRSLLPPNRAQAIENIETRPSATGRNPTISTVINFSIMLPTDSLYCPSLSCGVYDYIFKGVSQPQIGNFDVPIGDFQHEQEDKFQDEHKLTLKIIKTLEQRIKDPERLLQDIKDRQARLSRKVNALDSVRSRKRQSQWDLDSLDTEAALVADRAFDSRNPLTELNTQE